MQIFVGFKYAHISYIVVVTSGRYIDSFLDHRASLGSQSVGFNIYELVG